MSEISKSIQIICDEKGLDPKVVLDALETALAAAYRKDFGTRQGNYKVKFDSETGDMLVWDVKEVVEDVAEEELEKAQEELTRRREEAREEGRELTEEEAEDLVRFNPKTQMMMTEAKTIKAGAEIGEVLEIPQEIPKEFGRMAAQTAKQVIIQKLREAERNVVFGDFKKQEGQIVQGTVQRRDRAGAVIIDLGKITGIVPQNEQVRKDQYRPGMRLRFYVVSVALGMRGPEIILSRSHENMVRAVFAQEIPEIADESVEIKGVARDAGNRSKVAVWTDDDTIDPIGSCIGQRGSRITTIIDELGGEKIDIIQWSGKVVEFIKNALSPAKVDHVELNEEEKEAVAHVVEDQFSLAIGRGGQNVRLAAQLTGWRIRVEQEGTDVAVTSEDNEEEVHAVLEGGTEEVSSGEAGEETGAPEAQESADPIIVEKADEEKTEESPAEETEEKEKKEE